MRSQALAVPLFHETWTRTRNNLSEVVSLANRTDILGMASSIGYYTVLSLTPFLLLFFTLLGLIGMKDVPEIRAQVIGVLGPGANVVLTSIQDRLQTDEGGLAFGLFGLITLLISTTGVISRLQFALNAILIPTETLMDPRLRPDLDTQLSPTTIWMRTKLFSVVAVIVCMFVSTASLILSVAAQVFFPIHGQRLWDLINFAGSISIFSIVFTLMFRYLPTTESPKWGFSLRAGLLCSVFFHIGKFTLENYFAHAGVASSYGALSSFVVFLLWAYYNGLIILASACFAKVYFNETN